MRDFKVQKFGCLVTILPPNPENEVTSRETKRETKGDKKQQCALP